MRQKDELISRQAAIDALMAWEEDSFWDDECLKHRGEPFWVAPSDVIEQLPSAQPEPSQVARDIATIIENEKDMRVIASAQPDKQLEKIADLVEGTIDHFDRDDAMDLLYQIKEVIRDAVEEAKKDRINCAHCKRYDRHGHRCKWWNHGVSNVDWCSYAERKEEHEIN